MSKKKVVIIGSGLGGLSCGYILQRNGYDVTILEQGLQAGGCLQCFDRRGVRFETGMHFIGSAAPGQTLHSVLQYLGLGHLPLSELDTGAYNKVHLDGQSFDFPNGREAFLEKMGAFFPAEKDGLARYIAAVDGVAAASALSSLTSQERDMAANTMYQTLSINEVLDGFFHDELLKQVLVGDLPLYAAQKDKTPFAQHAFIMDFYNQSAFRIEGGSDKIATSLCDSIRSMGGEMLLRSKVTAIECDTSGAKAVVLEDGRAFPCDYVIGAIHPSRLLELLQTPFIRPAFRSRISSLPQTTSIFALYVKFKEGKVPYLNSNYFGYDGESPWGCEDYDEASWPKGFLYMHMCHQDKAQWARSGVVLSYMNYADVARWEGLPIGRRGPDYEEFKKAHAQKLIRHVDKQIPGFAEGIDSFWTSTPLTYRDYTGTEAGSLYGVAKDISLGPGGRVPYRTKIPNLFLAGQNVNSHGMLGVIVGTIVTCSELVPPQRIFQQIKEAEKL